jgi:hypothetical protein
MRPILSSLPARLLLVGSVVIAIPVVAVLFAMTMVGTAVMGVIAALQPRPPRAEPAGPLVIDGEYTVVEARTVPIQPRRRR